jgi:hypothetical protein
MHLALFLGIEAWLGRKTEKPYPVAGLSWPMKDRAFALSKKTVLTGLSAGLQRQATLMHHQGPPEESKPCFWNTMRDICSLETSTRERSTG